MIAECKHCSCHFVLDVYITQSVGVYKGPAVYLTSYDTHKGTVFCNNYISYKHSMWLYTLPVIPWSMDIKTNCFLARELKQIVFFRWWPMASLTSPWWFLDTQMTFCYFVTICLINIFNYFKKSNFTYLFMCVHISSHVATGTLSLSLCVGPISLTHIMHHSVLDTYAIHTFSLLDYFINLWARKC